MTSSFLPYNSAGTEIFALEHAKSLIKTGNHVEVAFHANDPAEIKNRTYDYESIPVTILPYLKYANTRMSLYRRTVNNADGFQDYLEETQPDIVHFHGFSSCQGLRHLEICRQCNIRTVYTMHTPGQWCSQSNLLYRGKSVCDGKLMQYRCTECRYNFAGVPLGISHLLAYLPSLKMLENSSGRIGRLLTIPLTVSEHRNSWFEFYESVDRVHVLSQWAMDMLHINGLATDKAVLIRSGINASDNIRNSNTNKTDSHFKIGFVGRFTETKGPHVLIKAIQECLPEMQNIQAYIFSSNARPDTPYRKKWLNAIEKDSRFKSPEYLDHDSLLNKLRELDVLVVPSMWLETGPLTVLETFAAGVPVIGSNLGGIAENVQHGVNGLLFERGNHKQLAMYIKNLITSPSQLELFKSSVSAPRTMDQVAAETVELYQTLNDCK